MKVDAALFVAAVITIIYQFAFFMFAAYFKFDKLTDLAGGTNFVLLALVAVITSKVIDDSSSPRQLTVSIIVILWGIRLSAFLFYRIMLFSTDRRFDGTRENPWRFLVFWILQMTWVFIVSLPYLVLNITSRHCHQDVGYIDYIGFLMAGMGLLLEVWADHTKLRFKLYNTEKEWCDEDLWKYSRHPNYFGEILFWWGIFTACSPCLHDAYILTIIGPIYVTLLLLFLSGIPPLESAANGKWKHLQDYQEYRNDTSVLIPLPRYFYGSLPKVIKQVFFFEWPLYEANLDTEIEDLTNAINGTI